MDRFRGHLLGDLANDLCDTDRYYDAFACAQRSIFLDPFNAAPQSTFSGLCQGFGTSSKSTDEAMGMAVLARCEEQAMRSKLLRQGLTSQAIDQHQAVFDDRANKATAVMLCHANAELERREGTDPQWCSAKMPEQIAIAHALSAGHYSSLLQMLEHPEVVPPARSKLYAAAFNARSKAVRAAGCSWCGTPAAKLHLCTRCKSVAYCNAACQRSHWREGRRSLAARWPNFETPATAAAAANLPAHKDCCPKEQARGQAAAASQQYHQDCSAARADASAPVRFDRDIFSRARAHANWLSEQVSALQRQRERCIAWSSEPSEANLPWSDLPHRARMTRGDSEVAAAHSQCTAAFQEWEVEAAGGASSSVLEWGPALEKFAGTVAAVCDACLPNNHASANWPEYWQLHWCGAAAVRQRADGRQMVGGLAASIEDWTKRQSHVLVDEWNLSSRAAAVALELD
jgi:hypothetical protein